MSEAKYKTQYSTSLMGARGHFVWAYYDDGGNYFEEIGRVPSDKDFKDVAERGLVKKARG